ncbi:hypothetical protein BGX38DRAFT_1177803, partial [Terfezia claveryi]
MSNDQPRTDTSTYKLDHTILDYPDAKFRLYHLVFDSSEADRYGKVWTDQEGLLELTHNYGTEGDPNYKVNNGNDDPEHQDKLPVAASEAPQKPEWCFSHSMIRVKNMEASTLFYASYLGMATLFRTKSQGIRHVCICVDDLGLACYRFEGMEGI